MAVPELFKIFHIRCGGKPDLIKSIIQLNNLFENGANPFFFERKNSNILKTQF